MTKNLGVRAGLGIGAVYLALTALAGTCLGSSFGLRVCRDGFDADDAVQEAFAKLAVRREVVGDRRKVLGIRAPACRWGQSTLTDTPRYRSRLH